MKKQLFITGGLGNQMFEYAYFLTCKKKEAKMVLNIDIYNVNRMHNGYMLGRAFGIDNTDILSSNRVTTFISRVIRRYAPLGLVYDEHFKEYNPDAYRTFCPYINGVFIGERYFRDVKDEIRNVFSFVGISQYNQILAEKMRKEVSVSLHIRRGDYLFNPIYAVCQEEYYHKAIDHIKRYTQNPKIYVFSDEPEWSTGFMQRFGVDFEIIKHNQGADSYQDMYLMTQCRHNIIANSTFSWWGAYLNSNTEKIVVCPDRWFKGAGYNPCMADWVWLPSDEKEPKQPKLISRRGGGNNVIGHLTTKGAFYWLLYYIVNATPLRRWLSDKAYLTIQYRCLCGKPMNWKNPQTFNEKLQWLKVYDHNPEYTKMVDKYEAKKYVASIIGDEYIIPTLGIWDSVDDIDWDSLPNQFVLKCTHDSGGLVVCRDKRKLDKQAAIKKIKDSLKVKFYYATREWPYKYVKPRVLAEKYMEDKSGELIDYKYFCFNGEPKAIFIASDRLDPTVDTKFDFFDMDFNHLDFRGGHPNATKPVLKPAGFEHMKELARELSKSMPHVRVDFYEVDGKVYFGELTFYHWGGMAPFEPEEWNYRFGEWIQLSKLKF